MKNNPLTRFRAWTQASPARQWTVGLAALVVIGVGAYLAVEALVPPTPPDLGHADNQQIVDFLALGDFDRLSSGGRSQFLDRVSDRYIQSDAQTRADFDRRLREAHVDPGVRRRISNEVYVAMGLRLAQEYQSLTPAEREAFLDRTLFLITSVSGGSDFLAWVDSNPTQDILTKPDSAFQELTPFQARIVNGTSATDRALLTQLGEGLLERAQRYKRR